MIDICKDYWWAFTTLVIIIVFFVKLGYSLREQKLRIQVLERDLKIVSCDSGQLMVAMLAVLDGLKQQGCNGLVTSAHTALKTYLATNRITHIDDDH